MDIERLKELRSAGTKDFTNADWSGCELKYASLSKVDLSGAKLRLTNLRGANSAVAG